MSEESGEVGDKRLGAYLQQISLLTDADEKDENADTVKLMTIHAAKGLEFPVVFVCGLEEMLFPNGISVNTREELEEERRLFYVAITRAKHRLWLTYANTRYRFGQLVQNDKSRFLGELPEEFVDQSSAGGGARNQGSNWGTAFERMHRGFSGGGWGESQERNAPKPAGESKPSYLAPPRPKQVEHVPSPDFVPSDISGLKEGNKVEHQKFGFGVVTRLEGSAHNPIATIKFEHNGEKKIMLNYAKLRILE
jgi:DNA helicase-2/ATP-dependent DNA helicase PcrA